MALEDWQRVIVETVDWLGPIRVCFRGQAAQSELLVKLVRFANRLECPTHLVTAGPLHEDLSLALVDAGLGAATVRIGALDKEGHLASTGISMDETLATVDYLGKAREDRKRPLVLLGSLTLSPATVSNLGAMAGLARQVGVDGVLAQLAVEETVPPGAVAALQGLGAHRTSPALVAVIQGRKTRMAPGLRLEVRSDGTLRTSERTAPLGKWSQGTLQEQWEAADEAVSEALGLDRLSDEVELVPEMLYSHR